MPDDTSLQATGLTAPARAAAAVTPADAATLDPPARGLYVGQAGDLRVRMLGGQTVTFVAVPGGSVLPLRVDRVFATGTTAASIVALR